jgi:thiol-disulfide isomerase/thioredoxin
MRNKWLSKSKLINGLFIAVLVILIVSPSAKALMIRGLMEIGFFQPSISKPSAVKVVSLPELSLKNSEGQTINLADLHGKVIFLNFWATWCPPCVAEMPSIDDLHNKMISNKNIVFITVDVDGNLTKSRQFLKKHKLTLPLYQATSAISPELLGNAIPTTIIFDKSGAMVFHHEGGADYTNPKVLAYLNQIAQ